MIENKVLLLNKKWFMQMIHVQYRCRKIMLNLLNFNSNDLMEKKSTDNICIVNLDNG